MTHTEQIESILKELEDLYKTGYIESDPDDEYDWVIRDGVKLVFIQQCERKAPALIKAMRVLVSVVNVNAEDIVRQGHFNAEERCKKALTQAAQILSEEKC